MLMMLSIGFSQVSLILNLESMSFRLTSSLVLAYSCLL
jgi:hypothetical protein